jgi:hypothetical protein
MCHVPGAGSSINGAMKWMAVLFAKNTLVAVNRVLNGRKLTGPEHSAYLVSTSVAKVTVPSINVLRGR